MSADTQQSLVNTRLVVVGGAIAALGAAAGAVGAMVLGAAAMSALRQWAQSEQRQELVAKAKLASAAAADSWRRQMASDIVLPDARTPAPTR